MPDKETLEIEVNVMAGNSELKLTGNMGDVMKESAMIAYSLVRSLTMSESTRLTVNFMISIIFICIFLKVQFLKMDHLRVLL